MISHKDLGDEYSQAAAQLKTLVRLAVNRGFSYAHICSSMGSSVDWRPNSLRQFVHRKSVTRKDQKVEALAEVIREYFSGEQGGSRLPQSEVENFNNVVSVIIENNSDYRSSYMAHLDSRLRDLRSTTLDFQFPKRFAICRYTVDSKYIIKIIGQSFRVSDGIVCVMRIMGDQERKRIVIGNFYSTLINTNFVGLAYKVDAEVSESRFAHLNFFDDGDRDKYISSNELGFEYFSLENFSIHNKRTAIYFTGLDGRAKPIAGKGLFIKEQSFAEFDIDKNAPSTITCNNKDISLGRQMRALNCNTLKYTDSIESELL